MSLILSSSINLTGAVSAPTIIIQNGGGGIVSSSQQIQNYNVFAVTSSANTFYGNQTINGTLGVSIGGSTELSVQQTGVTLGNVVTDRHMVTGSVNITGSLTISGSMGIGTNTPAALLETRVGIEPTATNKVALIAATGNGANDIFRWFDGATQLGVFKNSGRVSIGPSTAPTYKLEVSTASGSERIRVGTLQNNSNTATFEAITSAGLTTATSGWIRAVYGGGLAVGTSTYTKANGDSGDFSNLSGEAASTAITVNGGNTTLSGGLVGSYTSATSGYVNETQTITAFTTSYFLYKYTGTNNGSSQTTFNLTGLPATNGTIIDVVLHVAKDGTAGAINTAANLEINGNDLIGTIFASGTGAVNTVKTFRVGRFDGTWRVIGQVGG